MSAQTCQFGEALTEHMLGLDECTQNKDNTIKYNPSTWNLLVVPSSLANCTCLWYVSRCIPFLNKKKIWWTDMAEMLQIRYTSQHSKTSDKFEISSSQCRVPLFTQLLPIYDLCEPYPAPPNSIAITSSTTKIYICTEGLALPDSAELDSVHGNLIIDIFSL